MSNTPTIPPEGYLSDGLTPHILTLQFIQS